MRGMAKKKAEKHPESRHARLYKLLVVPSGDRMGPISRLLDPKDIEKAGTTREELSLAVLYMTGGPAKFFKEGDMVRVTAAGGTANTQG